uniref:uncharacterized protein LOC122609398 n=1 Tax=Erigeron canadensis TaxID=72917 RepID=UPI001CB9CF3D|nr:uncharacterized protein LOC122609398 [Erigeron canadensis]
MKVHPITPIKRNLTIQPPQITTTSHRQKKLRRLPHIFAKVLELPFYSNTDVSIQETSESLRFVVDTDDDIGPNISAHMIEIYPGVTKIVVGGINFSNISNHSNSDNNDNVVNNDFDMIDVWRFRLPDYTQPELATASFSDGELVVVVPKFE